MEEMSKLGCNCTIISSDSNQLASTPKLTANYQIEKMSNLTFVWLKTYKYVVAKSVKRILSWFHFEWRLFFFNKKLLDIPDVVIVSSLSLLTVLNGLYLKKRYKCLLIFEIRDIWPLTLLEEGGYSPKNVFVKFLAWVEKLGYNSADIIVGTMPNLGQHFSDLGYAKKPIHCIPMGVSDEVFFDTIVPESLSNLCIPKDKFVVCYAGTIGITNALDPFFDSIEKLKDNHDIHFLILGDGALKNQYKK
ncbi:glycosyltransferase family 4 protein [bacterium]|nr:glycosyltransferase family 4 protein [bacterium]